MPNIEKQTFSIFEGSLLVLTTNWKDYVENVNLIQTKLKDFYQM